MCYKNNGYSLAVKHFYSFHNLSAAARIKHSSGFIKHNALWLHCKNAGNGNTLLLPAGKLMRCFFAQFIHTDCFKCFIHPSAAFIRRYPKIFNTECHILFHNRCHNLIIGILKNHSDIFADFKNILFT